MPPTHPSSTQKEQDAVEKKKPTEIYTMYNKYETKDGYLFPLCDQVTICITLVQAELIKLL
jgi:hypothetical protein